MTEGFQWIYEKINGFFKNLCKKKKKKANLNTNSHSTSGGIDNYGMEHDEDYYKRKKYGNFFQ